VQLDKLLLLEQANQSSTCRGVDSAKSRALTSTLVSKTVRRLIGPSAIHQAFPA